MLFRCAIVAGSMALMAGAQTQVDLRTQSKSIDFTEASTTKPIKTGGILPVSCAVGEAFFLTTASPGSNLYLCASQNNWILQLGAQGPAGPKGDTGPAGATGPEGDTGVPGPTGPAGTNGNTILTGTTTPGSGLGVNGDYYIRNPATAPCLFGPKSTGTWPGACVSLVGPTGATGAQGAAGPQGATGAMGTAGANGNTILSGTTVPTAAAGNNGDFYILNPTTAPCLYGPKASGSWPGSCITLVGASGTFATNPAAMYVNHSSGNDGNAGTSSGAATQTIGRALANLPPVIATSVVIHLTDSSPVTYAEPIDLTSKTCVANASVTVQADSAIAVTFSGYSAAKTTITSAGNCTLVLGGASQTGTTLLYQAGAGASAIAAYVAPGATLTFASGVPLTISGAYSQAIYTDSGTVNINAATTVTGYTFAGLNVQNGGLIYWNSTSPTISLTSAASGASFAILAQWLGMFRTAFDSTSQTMTVSGNHTDALAGTLYGAIMMFTNRTLNATQTTTGTGIAFLSTDEGDITLHNVSLTGYQTYASANSHGYVENRGTATAINTGGCIVGTFGSTYIPSNPVSGCLAEVPSGGATTIASGVADMRTTSIASGTCAAAVTVTATGVTTTDVITFTPNADPTAITGYGPATTGSLYIWPYPTTGNVNFKVCNNTGSAITPGSLRLNWRVSR